MPSAFSKKPYQVNFSSSSAATVPSLGKLSTNNDRAESTPPLDHPSRGLSPMTNSPTQHSFRRKNSKSALHKMPPSALKVPQLHEIYNYSSPGGAGNRKTRKRKSPIPSRKTQHKKSSKRNSFTTDASWMEHSHLPHLHAAGPTVDKHRKLSRHSNHSPVTSKRHQARSVQKRNSLQSSPYAAPVQSNRSSNTPTRRSSLENSPNATGSSVHQLIPVANPSPEQFTKHSSKVMSQSLIQRYQNAKSRISRLWEWLEIPQKERQYYVDTYFDYPSLENMKVLNKQIQTLLSHRVDVLRVLRKISEREELMRKLNALIYRFEETKLDRSSLVLAEASQLLEELRRATKKCVHAIDQWSESLSVPKPFTWNGEDYKQKMQNDVRSLNSSKLVRTLQGMPLKKRQRLFEDAYGKVSGTTHNKSSESRPQKLHTEKRFHERYHFILQRKKNDSPTSSMLPSDTVEELKDHQLSPPLRKMSHKRSPLQNRLLEPKKNLEHNYSTPTDSRVQFPDSFHTYHTPEHYHEFNTEARTSLDLDEYGVPVVDRGESSPLRAFSENLSETSFNAEEFEHSFSSPSVTQEEEEDADIDDEIYWAHKRDLSADSHPGTRMKLAPLKFSSDNNGKELYHTHDLGAGSRTHRPHTRLGAASRSNSESIIHSARRSSQTPLPSVSKRSPISNIPSNTSLLPSKRRFTATEAELQRPAAAGDKHHQADNASVSSRIAGDHHSQIRGFIPTLKDESDNRMVIYRNSMKTVIGRAQFSETLNNLVQEDEAALTIQCSMRRYLHWQQFQEAKVEHERFLQSLIWIQSVVRAQMPQNSLKISAASKVNAVLRIQRMFRGFVARREATVMKIVREMEKEEKIIQEHQAQAALVLQCNYRSFAARREYNQHLQRMKASVKWMHAVAETYRHQMQYLHWRNNIIRGVQLLQNQFRSLICLSQMSCDIENIIQTQALCRRFSAIYSAKEQAILESTLAIQCAWRRAHALSATVQLKADLKHEEDLIHWTPTIQALCRYRITHSSYRNTLDAICLCQSTLRASAIRHAFEEYLFNKAMHEKRELNAKVIQTQARVFLAKKELERRRITRLRNAHAIKIQSCVRIYLAQRQLQKLRFEKMRAQQCLHVQCWIRSSLARVELDGLKEKKHANESASKIQAAWKIFVAKTVLSNLRLKRLQISAATVIQHCYRRHLAHRYSMAEVIQRAWRCHVARKALFERAVANRRRIEAIISVQSACRCYLAQNDLEEAHKIWKRNQAAETLQRSWRLFAARRLLLKLEQHHQRLVSAQVIQRAWKVYMAKNRLRLLREERKKALGPYIIQRAWRVYSARKILESLRMEKKQIRSALVIQSAWRCFAAKQILFDLQDKHQKLLSSEVIQRAWRTFAARRKLSTLREERQKYDAAITVQCAWRVHRACKTLQQLHVEHRKINSALVIQCAWRRHRAILHRQQLEYQWRKERVAVMLQSTWRRHLAQMQFQGQLADHNRNQSALTIQCTWRTFVAKKHLQQLRIDFIHKVRQCAAITLQSTWKGFTMRKVQSQRHAASVCIQSVFRGYLARVLTEELRARYIAQQQLVASTAIQRAWRCYCSRRVRSTLEQESASKLEAVYLLERASRMQTARLIFDQLREFLIVARTNAASTIQRAYRSHVAREKTMERRLQVEKDIATPLLHRYAFMSHSKYEVYERKLLIHLQSTLRSHLQQYFSIWAGEYSRDFSELIDAASRIQRTWRAFKVRKETHTPLLSQLRTRGANVVQSLLLSDMVRKDFSSQIECVVLVQSCIRGHALMQRKLRPSSQLVQNAVRRNTALYQSQSSLQSIALTQALLRRNQTFEDYCLLRSQFVFQWTEEMVGNSSLYAYCALVIQQAWRLYAAQKKKRHRTQEIAAVTIQCCWRRYTSRILVEKLRQKREHDLARYLADERFAVQIQRFVRGHQARRLAHQTRQHDKEALIRSLYSASFEKVSEEMNRIQQEHQLSLHNLIENLEQLQSTHSDSFQRVSNNVQESTIAQRQALLKLKEEMNSVYGHHDNKVKIVNDEISNLRHQLQEAQARQKHENAQHILQLHSRHHESVSELNAEIDRLRGKLHEAEQTQKHQTAMLQQMEDLFMNQIEQLKKSLQYKQDVYSIQPHQVQQRAHVCITLQRVARGFLARKRAETLRKLCNGNIERLQEQRRSVAIIERFWLSHREKRKHEASMTIQLAFKQYKSRILRASLQEQQDDFVRRLVVPIQRVYRGYLDRKHLREQDEAAHVLTRFFRRVLAWRHELRMNESLEWYPIKE